MTKKDTVSNSTISTKVGDVLVPTPFMEIVVEQTPKVSYNSTVKLQLNIDAHAVYTGKVTQRQYEWARAGSIVTVDSLDASYLLEKRIKSHSCCSGSDVAVFVQID